VWPELATPECKRVLGYLPTREQLRGLMPKARAKAEGRNVEVILQEDAQNELNLSDDENASGANDGGQAAPGTSTGSHVEPTSAPKRGGFTPRGRGTPAGRGGRGGKAMPRVTAAQRRATSTPGSGSTKKGSVNQDRPNDVTKRETVFICSILSLRHIIQKYERITRVSFHDKNCVLS
jgi:hypothetical protein